MNTKILVAEDETRIRTLLRMYLEKMQCSVEEADNGIDALEKAIHNHYDLILLDVFMPGKNGLEVLKELRQTKSTPVIVLTAQGGEIEQKQGFDLGANAYLLKPFSPKDVMKEVQNLLGSAT